MVINQTTGYEEQAFQFLAIGTLSVQEATLFHLKDDETIPKTKGRDNLFFSQFFWIMSEGVDWDYGDGSN